MIKYISIDFCEGKLITAEISGSMYWVGEDALNSFRTSHTAAMNYHRKVRYGSMEQNHQPHMLPCLKTRQCDPGKKGETTSEWHLFIKCDSFVSFIEEWWIIIFSYLYISQLSNLFLANPKFYFKIYYYFKVKNSPLKEVLLIKFLWARL